MSENVAQPRQTAVATWVNTVVTKQWTRTQTHCAMVTRRVWRGISGRGASHAAPTSQSCKHVPIRARVSVRTFPFFKMAC